MSRLILVRHGQAKPFEENPDQLSETGIEQALRLGRHLAARGIVFSEVYSGSLERQKRTMLLISQGYREAHLAWPSMRLDRGWNEYDSEGVLRHIAPLVSSSDPAFAELVFQAETFRNTPEANKYFQKMFETLMRRWTAGEFAHDEVESWEAFRTRVTAALGRILAAAGESRNVLVVSSGGPIGTAVQQLLESPPRLALEMNWRMKNASLTEFLFAGRRVTMDTFNTVAHLDPALTTYR